MDIKNVIEDLGRAFELFKAENDKRLKQIEERGSADILTVKKVDALSAEISQLAAKKEKIDERLHALEVRAVRPHYGGGVSQEKSEHLEAFNKWLRKGIDAGLKDIEIKAAASTLSNPEGGFTVPEEIDKTIDRVATKVSAMRRLATVRSISTDTYKKLVSMGGATSGWTEEKAARLETSTPTLAEIAINAKEFYAMPAATQTLLDDSSIDIGAWLAEEVAIEFAEQESAAFINGNGVSKPKGIAAYDMVPNANYTWGKVGYVTSGHASQLNNADRLIDLVHSLRSIYRGDGVFLMNDTTMAEIRKLKDNEGNYLWRPGLAAGVPDTLLGKPVEIDDNVDNIGAGKFPVFFANFKRAYMIIDRQGTMVLRDPYTKKPYVLFYTTRRVGGGIIMYEAIKALKIGTS